MLRYFTPLDWVGVVVIISSFKIVIRMMLMMNKYLLMFVVYLLCVSGHGVEFILIILFDYHTKFYDIGNKILHFTDRMVEFGRLHKQVPSFI